MIALLVGGGTVGAFITGFFNRRKTGAEAEATLSSAILAYTNKLTADNDKLRVDFVNMQQTVDKLQEKLKETADLFKKAESHANELKEIVTALETRRANDKVIIDRLFAAVKAADPNNPLLIELQSLAAKAAAVPTVSA